MRINEESKSRRRGGKTKTLSEVCSRNEVPGTPFERTGKETGKSVRHDDTGRQMISAYPEQAMEV